MRHLPPKHLLSKSTFMRGWQCHRRLWLHKFNPEVRDEESEQQTAIFQSGTNVGLLARQLFPGGIDASPIDAFHYQDSVYDTAEYIKQGHSIIYEAAFQYDGVLAAIDILVKKEDKWYAYEVKSSTKVKEPFVQDAALQYWVITNTGLPLEDICIVHLNTDYVRYGTLDIQQLFATPSVKKEVISLQPTIAQKAVELKNALQLLQEPAIAPGAQCNKPYACDFQSHCTKDVIVLPRTPEEERIVHDELNNFLSQLQYPVYFMDFETYMEPVPQFDGHWSYRKIPFQFSVHIQQVPGGELLHKYFLADNNGDCCRQFTEALLDVIDDEGTVMVYNKAFENTILKELAEEFEEHTVAIAQIQSRIVDLMVPFRKKHFRVPEMDYSYSIKYVLPALVPELSYDELAIGNGGDASAAFYNLRFESDWEKIRETRDALLEYCGLDTMAMVKVLEKLKEAI
jgi:hypothetical protein